MAFRTGRCTNDLFCSFASGQQDLQVPAEGNFVCPQCGKALSDPPANAGRGGVRLAVVTGGSLAAAGAMLFLAGMFLGGRGISPPIGTTELAASTTTRPMQPPAPPAPASVHEDNPAPKATVDRDVPPPPAAVPLPAAHAVQADAAAPQVATGAAAQTGAQPPTPGAVAPNPVVPPAIHLAMIEQARSLPPAPAVAPPQSVAPKPDDLAQTRRAQAQAEQAKRAQAQAEQAKKVKALADQARKDKALADAKRARQDALDAEREEAEARAAQDEAAKERAAQDEAARQRAEQEAAAKPPPVVVAVAQPPAPKPAAAPAGPSRGFSTSPVAGGAPPYPAELENDGRSGSVTVACRILEDGHPSGCRVVSARGGEPFKGAVLGWLNSGRVRYAPILHGGKPVAETHQWSVQFQPE
jgi:protein TonB